MKKVIFRVIIALGFVLLLFVQCASSPRSTITIKAKDIQDYICVVNRSLPPNLERFIKSVQGAVMRRNDIFSVIYPPYLESIRRGGHGSGFVYVDNKGNNYIVTNYHVIVGAARLSATFENEKGEKTEILNLSVLNADERADLAILAFPEGVNPFKKGLPLKTLTDYIAQKQDSNFSIPNEMINSFLVSSLAKDDERTILNKRVESFLALLVKSGNNNVYEDISLLLSNAFIARDPMGTADALPDYGIGSVLQDKIIKEPFIGIGWAVAYNQIENSGYKRGRSVQTELISVSPNNFGGYTAKLLINSLPYKTEWVREYGTWKIDDFTDDDGEYNNLTNFATPHPLEKKIIYTLSSLLDVDWYVLSIPSAGKLTVWTEGSRDTALELYYDPTTEESQKRTLIGYDDDSGDRNNAKVSENVRAGKVYVQVSLEDGSSGEYTLVAELK